MQTYQLPFSVRNAKFFAYAVVAAIIAALFLMFGNAPPANAAACQRPSIDYGTATMTIAIPEAATYRIWTRMMAPDNNNNTYLLEVDGKHCFTVGGAIAANNWVWVAHQNGNTNSKIDLSLTKGNHTVKLIGRQPNVKVNNLVFTSDLNCTPTGNGSNCDRPADTTAPSVSLTAPTDSSAVTGTVDVTATANDSTGVTKVEFYINSSLAGTITSAPYTYKWNTATVPNGSQQLLTVKAYDAAGNVGTDSARVTVQNGDTQPPTAPVGVKAVADAHNQVTLTWNASTDNTGIKGYSITRNGMFLREVGAVTSYQDKTILPNAEYKYRVTAIDISGNKSAPSAEANVKIPHVPDTEAPTTPRKLTARAVSPTQINLSWKASTDNVKVAGYDVYRGSRKIATVATTSFGDAGLRPHREYSYTVRARDAAGNTSAPSSVATIKTQVKKSKAIVRGKVTDASSKRSLRFALIEITISGKRHFSITNWRGEFTLRGLEPGRYTITYRAFGHHSKSVRVTIHEGQSRVVQTVSLDRKFNRR